MTSPAPPWLLTTDGPRIAEVRVQWVLPPVDVRRRERRAVAGR